MECIGSLDSSLKGQEEIYTREPYIQGKIVGLERGEILKNSSLIKAMVSDIVKRSKYAEKEKGEKQNYDGVMIDDTELGFELGYGKEISVEDGTIIKKVKWPEDSTLKVHSTILNRVSKDDSVKINGIRANFILSTICKACKQAGVQDISAYDIRQKKYIPIHNIPQKRGIRETEGLVFHKIENKKSVFLDIDISKEQFLLEDYKKCILPKIKENKDLYISGRMPLWLLASISISYDSNRIYTFQPGKGFTCISSINERDLGNIVDGIDGINLKKYFEDKKEMENKNLYPTVVEKKSILSEIKKLWTTIKNKRKESEYLDESIIATKNEQNIKNTNSISNSFQRSLKQEISHKNLESRINTNKKSKDIELSKIE